jgi:hypothetical protein
MCACASANEIRSPRLHFPTFSNFPITPSHPTSTPELELDANTPLRTGTPRITSRSPQTTQARRRSGTSPRSPTPAVSSTSRSSGPTTASRTPTVPRSARTCCPSSRRTVTSLRFRAR